MNLILIPLLQTYSVKKKNSFFLIVIFIKNYTSEES
jgi:hypothetical protein